MNSRTYNIRVLGVIAGVYAIVLALDLFVLPGHFLVSTFYAVPILIAAMTLPPLIVGLVSLVSLFLDLLTALAKAEPIVLWPYELFSMAVIAYLSVLLAREFKEVSQRAKDAEEARQRLQEFIGMVAHDLRGPLTVLLGYIQMLGKGRGTVPPEVSDNAIRAAESQARRMNRLIGDLLDASHIGTGRFTIERQRLDLVKLTRQVVEEQQATTTKHRIALRAPASLEGYWDAGRITQVLTNLLTNAIKYSPEGGEVQVDIVQVDDNAVVKVTDEGIGIAPEDIPLLFEPFSRLYREQPIRGTGLGLYISKAIVEAHGGRIWVESPGRGKGSTFAFTLPASRDSEQG